MGEERDDEEHVRASILNPRDLDEACTGASRVIHLAGIPTEAPWEDINNVNITGTHNVLEAVRKARVSNFVYASSNHAVGFFRKSAGTAPDYQLPLPDTNYGVSKAAGEAMASLYSSR